MKTLAHHRLEEMVTTAEAAQMRAENELLEYAAERRKTEEALIAMQQQLEKVPYFKTRAGMQPLT